MQAELFHADSFVIGDALLVAVVGPPQAVVADAAVEIALVITANELKGFAVFEAV